MTTDSRYKAGLNTVYNTNVIPCASTDGKAS